MFTPNHDGKNDNFEVINLPDKSSVIITNRWGKEVYRSSDLKQIDNTPVSIIWSGGGEADGIYFYTLNTPSKNVYRLGRAYPFSELNLDCKNARVSTHCQRNR